MHRPILTALAAVVLPLSASAQTMSCDLDIGTRYVHGETGWTAEPVTDDSFAFTLTESGSGPVLTTADHPDPVPCDMAGDLVTCSLPALVTLYVNVATGLVAGIEVEGLASGTMAHGTLSGAGSCTESP